MWKAVFHISDRGPTGGRCDLPVRTKNESLCGVRCSWWRVKSLVTWWRGGGAPMVNSSWTCFRVGRGRLRNVMTQGQQQRYFGLCFVFLKFFFFFFKWIPPHNAHTQTPNTLGLKWQSDRTATLRIRVTSGDHIMCHSNSCWGKFGNLSPPPFLLILGKGYEAYIPQIQRR